MALFGVLISALLCCFLQVSATKDDFARRCTSLRPEKLVSNSTLTNLQFVPAGTTLPFPGNDPTCARPSQFIPVDICRISLSIPTSNRSSITFEAWLPRNWTGRFLGTGNGGVSGCIQYEDIAYGTQNGFASVGANNGHNGTSGVAFLNNPDIIKDFAFRSLHTTVVIGKKLTKILYGAPYTKSYYIGCSLGGRQGTKSAEMFPEDFDGIVVGAPAVDFNNLYSWRASFLPITGPVGSPNFITPTTWQTLIHNEILRQCDGIDGVLDGIIEDPTLCKFDPSTLLCGGTNTTDCLTQAQIDIVNTIFSPFRYPNGTLIYVGMNPGSEIITANGLYAGVPWQLSADWFKYVVFSDPTWDPLTFTTDDAIAAENLNPFNIRTWPSNLFPFWNRGGKVLIHHGQQDNQISSFDTPRFYSHLLQGTGFTPTQMDQFLRFFRISGMFHCSTGPGAWVIGQLGAAAAAGIPFDPKNNILAAAVEWVEKGIAPVTLEGTKFVNDTPSLGISFQRRHCKFPARNTFMGGDPSNPDSWTCVEQPITS